MFATAGYIQVPQDKALRTGQLCGFYIILYKGDKFCDFIFCFHVHQVPSEKESL